MGEILTWIAEEGFLDLGEYLNRNGVTFEFRSAAEFRSRHLTDAVAAALKASAWR